MARPQGRWRSRWERKRAARPWMGEKEDRRKVGVGSSKQPGRAGSHKGGTGREKAPPA
jgi:hypothetical protein